MDAPASCSRLFPSASRVASPPRDGILATRRVDTPKFGSRGLSVHHRFRAQLDKDAPISAMRRRAAIAPRRKVMGRYLFVNNAAL